ncbi:putative RET3-coatomer complex zeta chain [Tilletiaria anomala UBC 951]|uniref:Coatomer subunit zeta n=1 Tax=Tilletiaria anomala (strain ATCC 24038 / CBS 436.72 / UBC 951) TaxID=1037660 RepID=A0A066WR81_TILAU|nr:putative RET3-coatomer complex zeta chain [Tilletiaria anomala UBC 951]KDN53155.1 putative RET3-coatomer complex zeta chain [Tilletiaria anomala UBC 951]
MANLSLYTTTAFLLLDSDGDRVISKYYQPPHAANAPTGQQAGLQGPPQLSAKNPFPTVKEQKSFERAVWEKTRKSTGDILLYDSHLVLFRPSLDVTLYVIGPGDENPLMLSGLMSAIYDSISLLLRGQVEKRAILENLDLVTLAIDECVDDGIILETDSTAIASRVSRPRPDVTELQINEQTIMNAYSTLRDKVAQRILQS